MTTAQSSGRIYLSPPHLTGDEATMVAAVLESNWVAPAGPDLLAFETEFAEVVGVPNAVAVASGTAALHLALRLIGVTDGDEVLCPTLTFAATANAITYQGAAPVFVDSSPETWNVDPGLIEYELRSRARTGDLPAAIVTVDLYGQSADHDAIGAVASEYEVPVIEDAAEALGATYKDSPLGGFGAAGVFSFNGNKIITTSGGGMLVSHDQSVIDGARFLSTQARDPAPHYQHSVVGYNYRMSNVLAAIGRAQLMSLDERVAARRRAFATYVELLGDLPGIDFMPEADYGRATRWLTCLTIDPEIFGATREDVRLALERDNIEARPVWKPMHLQPVFGDNRVRGGSVAAQLFDRGLCLPSGSDLTRRQIERVAAIVAEQGAM